VTVEFTQTELGQHVSTAHEEPGWAHVVAQYSTGAQTAEVPAIRTVQHPVLHWVPFRQFAAQTVFDGSTVSYTHVWPVQQGDAPSRQVSPGPRHAGPASIGGDATAASEHSHGP
jgi:hypothetical protein